MGNPHLRCHKKHQHYAIISYFNTNTVKSIVISRSTWFVIKCFVQTQKWWNNLTMDEMKHYKYLIYLVNHLPESQMALVSAMFWRVQWLFVVLYNLLSFSKESFHSLVLLAKLEYWTLFGHVNSRSHIFIIKKLVLCSTHITTKENQSPLISHKYHRLLMISSRNDAEASRNQWMYAYIIIERKSCSWVRKLTLTESSDERNWSIARDYITYPY